MLACFRNKEESWAIKNARILLEESISPFDGKVNPIRCFSAQELEVATNNFDLKLRFHVSDCSLYKGLLRGQEVIVKKYYSRRRNSHIRDIVVASRLSVHKNVLKLIGCCLETEIPMLVYESFNYDGVLCDEEISVGARLNQQPPLAWKHRLKIAVDLGNLVAYLHTALSRPLIHRDLNLANIHLDKENGVVKLFSFKFCMSLPEGKSFIVPDLIVGTIGYIDPEYLNSSRCNEKADVYAFGVILLVLLCGQHSYSGLVAQIRDYAENDRFGEILDARLSGDGPWPGKDGQLEAFLMLALECNRDRGVDRPNMTQVGTRLAIMYRSYSSAS